VGDAVQGGSERQAPARGLSAAKAISQGSRRIDRATPTSRARAVAARRLALLPGGVVLDQRHGPIGCDPQGPGAIERASENESGP